MSRFPPSGRKFVIPRAGRFGRTEDAEKRNRRACIPQNRDALPELAPAIWR
jgi:hypothetical protein